MSDSRLRVLGRMRQALGRKEPTASQEIVESRLAEPTPTLIPARGNLEPEPRIELFIKQAEAVQASVQRIPSYSDLPTAIADYLRRHNLPLQLVMATSQSMTKAPWDKGLWSLREGKPNEEDPTGLTCAVAGIAETGTLMLASDSDHPTTLAFLPETSIIVLPSDQIHGAYEDALKTLRNERALPRSVNLITGPSRSGDIEQTLQLGAHGPRRLLIILIDKPTGDDGSNDTASSDCS